MALAMPSRFACLKIEGEDLNLNNVQKANKSKKVEARKEPPKKNNDKNSKKNTQKPNSAPQPKKEKKRKEHSQQWEEWKQRDNDLVDGYFEKDLQSAIMLSKLDFEHNKKAYEAQCAKKDSEGTSKKKDKKNKAMSLEQFNNLLSGGQSKSYTNVINTSNSKTDSAMEDEHFFETIDNETKRELSKDKNKENRKAREANIEEVITLAQCQQKLETQIRDNEVLRVELEKAKAEILTVKTRNKTLCTILGHGEMKDKADVLMELERLGHVKDELTEEVSRLHGLLEQERSKVAALTSEQHKHKDKATRKKHGV